MSAITKLPDGSAFFTATVMSKEEAMAMPVRERPLCFRISNEMYMAVWDAIGEAVNCYEPMPRKETLQVTNASDVVVRLCFKIADELEKKL